MSLCPTSSPTPRPAQHPGTLKPWALHPQVSSLTSSHTQGPARWGVGSVPLSAQGTALPVELLALALSHLVPFFVRIFVCTFYILLSIFVK